MVWVKIDPFTMFWKKDKANVSHVLIPSGGGRENKQSQRVNIRLQVHQMDRDTTAN